MRHLLVRSPKLPQFDLTGPDRTVSACLARVATDASFTNSTNGKLTQSTNSFCTLRTFIGDWKTLFGPTSTFDPYTSWVNSHLASITTIIQPSDTSVPCSVEAGWTSYGYPATTCAPVTSVANAGGIATYTGDGGGQAVNPAQATQMTGNVIMPAPAQVSGTSTATSAGMRAVAGAGHMVKVALMSLVLAKPLPACENGGSYVAKWSPGC